MHKITKGLKKKKKGKKSKRKEEELFKPEELEAYRQQHQTTSEEVDQNSKGKNEEWRKFLDLTSGVDDILKKTQGDLDRIKSTSFFQRVPPPSEVRKREEAAAKVEREEEEAAREEETEPVDLGIVQVSESESEEEDEDDIFDTAYIDAIAAGEVKLAYIPDSPTEQGDDPFDTAYAEKAILGPVAERKGKKLVPLGAAVEVLTGRAQITSTIRPTSKRRQILKERDLLLGSFDDNANAIPNVTSPEEAKKTLLDEDAPLPLTEEPIDLTRNLHPITPVENTTTPDNTKSIINEFDEFQVKDDEDDEDFALLAAESLAKSPVKVVLLPTSGPVKEENWSAFEEEKVDDPFDTTFAENIIPGKAELKIIEKEILQNDFDFDPRADEQINKVAVRTGVQIERISERHLNLITPSHRDLLGGSNTDLSNLNDQPLKPSEQIDENYIEYCDPFDTSIVETAQLPGTTELKFLERELLADIKQKSLSDDEFDPRAEESVPKERTLSRPDVLNFTPKTVSFDTAKTDLLSTEEELPKISKPLTPYVRKKSIPEEIEDNSDPFDTSFASDIAPGKAELKLIENELFDPALERTLSLSDQNFDPRDETNVKIEKIKEIVNPVTKPSELEVKKLLKIDLLSTEHDDGVKVLTPATETVKEIPYTDPFDTSIASNVNPGKAELKLLETELLHSDKTVETNRSLLDDSGDVVFEPPLNPSFDSFETEQDIDPFDTSIADNIVPGMDVKAGVNPFLFTDDDYVSPQSAASNPFLDDNYQEDETGDNPFLSQTATSMVSNSTNPFAFDPMDLGPTEGEIPQLQSNTFIDTSVNFTSTTTTSQVTSEFVGSAIQKPTELDLKYTNIGGDNNFIQTSTGPSRPPPPRPPPSKETQDLLMSVMGAMDATSTTLLDKIPPTRTPSPVSMRDLHSPSPTPEPTFGDLLDVDGGSKKVETDDLMSCDINQNPPLEQPHRPSPPVRPPRPAPPKPPPPAQVPPPKLPAEDATDLFGVAHPPKVASKADILNLYNAPKQEQVDLLFDHIEPEKKSETPEAVQEATVQDNFISPELSQNDLQMDTSNSQSKGSVSSVTFNPFAANEQTSPKQEDAFQPDVVDEVFQPEPVKISQTKPVEIAPIQETHFPEKSGDDFDAFTQKFESVKDEGKEGAFDAFSSTNNAWGNDTTFADTSGGFGDSGFGAEESFDAFLALQEPPLAPQSTPNRVSKNASQESDEDKDFSVVIRPKTEDDYSGVLPTIAPPPIALQTAFTDTSPRFNPFDNSSVGTEEVPTIPYSADVAIARTDSQETPPTPLFDEDVSQPLEPFPRINYAGEGWEMQLRQPNKKKITGNRFWKKIFVKLVFQADCVLLQLFNQQGDKDPFQELPLQPCYSVSDIGAQQYDQFGKIFTVKVQYIFYKERPGVRPGQVKKAERITNKLSQFAAYAIQGDYQGVKEFGSDLKKLGLPVEHAPQVSQLMKLGSLNYEDLKQFSFSFEEALFRLQAHRDRALHYKMEEVQITAVDELYVEQTSEGHIERQIARVRLFFLGFLTGMPDIELGINDMRRQGKEVVGRHDIIPVVTEEWIRLENVEFHSCIQQEDYEKTHIIKFKPPDACYIELLRFRVRPPRNRELPLQLKAQICVTGTRIELRADVLVPGFASRKLGQIPCEDVMIKFPIPECWIYLFRVEKHFRYGSVKSAHRRTGKIKGIERILGTVDTLQESLIEVTSGQAKYEHQHRAIVWRCPRLPKEGQGAYTTHNMVCKLALTSYDQMPEKLADYCYVEFTMPATQVSHMTCRSVSLQNSDSDDPPEKYVRYLARHEYRVGIEHVEGENPNAYASATSFVKPAVKEEQKPAPVPEESSSDSD